MEHGASRSGGEELLANLGWVRRLALAIVRDSGAADDVTQEVARVALERGEPVPASGLRAWLGAVTRRLALDRTRSDASRRARERSVARPEGDGSEAEIVERSARQQRVARAVMDLAEPYRSTILYRYLDEMPMAEVAQRTSVNEVTARKRLSRGLEMLRTRLDAEFGTSTRNWAIALLAPGKVTLIMSTKWIAAGAAAVIVGLGWWGWHVAHSPASSTGAPAIAADSHLEQPTIEMKDAPASAPIAPETAALTDSKRVSATLPPPDADATILHIRVLDRVGSAVTSGRIECAWSGMVNAPTADNRRFVNEEIHSAVTDVVLPPSAAEAFVRASTSGHLGTKESRIARLREGATGRIERDVRLVLDEPLDGPSLQGIVTVDGTRRVPHAFDIRFSNHGQSGDQARVNVVDASYALGHVAVGGTVSIASDEAVPVAITVTEENLRSGMLDLHLSSGHTLALTLVDRDDGHPLVDEDIIVERSSRVSDEVSAVAARTHRTDRAGKCEIRGLWKDQYVSVRPALESPRRPIIFDDDWGEQHLGKFSPTMDVPIAPQAWWRQRISGDEPVLEVTLRVKHTSEGATIFGSVSKEMLAGQADVLTRIRVAADEVDEQGRKNGYRFDVPIDAEGQWSFPVHWPSKYLVWVETVKSLAVLSTEASVDVTDAGRRGPIDLRPSAHETNFNLYVDNVTSNGRLSVTVFPAKGSSHSENIDCKGTSCTHPLKIEGECHLTVTWLPSGDWDTEVRRSAKVDPLRASSLRVDMGANQMRTIEFTVNGAAIPSLAVIGFGKLEETSQPGHETASTNVVDGRVRGRVALSPGRWFFECFDAKRDFNVNGVFEVKADMEVVSIARDVVAVDRAQVPHGIELTDVDGVKLDVFGAPIRYPELGASGKVLLNSTARYVALP